LIGAWGSPEGSDSLASNSSDSEQVRADVVAEAERLVERARQQGVPIRLLGGVAIKLRSKDLPAAFQRKYGDIDWVAAKGKSATAQKFFEDAGYAPEARFNALHGRDRLLFFDQQHGRQVDVFVGTFRMCHEIPFDKRLEIEPVTIPLAELLLTKLQVYEINEKDVGDALALMHEHGIGESDGPYINAARIASLCASDWGLWRTFTANLNTCGELIDRFDLSTEQKDALRQEVQRLQDRIEEEPKSRRWKLRARIGERKRWYELPEEVTEGRT
jgi:hypothetical protein